MARNPRKDAGAELAQSLIAGEIPTPKAEPALVLASEPAAPAQAGGFEIPPPGAAFAPSPGVGPVVLPSAGAVPIGDFVARLAEVGIKVTLPAVAAWSVEARAETWAWLTSGNPPDPGRIPAGLALIVGRANGATKIDYSGAYPREITSPTSGEQAAADAMVADHTSTAVAPSMLVAQPAAEDAPPPLFSVAKGGKVAPDLARIVESIYAMDAYKDFEDLKTGLALSESQVTYPILMRELGKAEDKARRMHLLYIGAKNELEEWEADIAKVASSMRERAREELEKDKKSGAMTKRIANADVEAVMADMFSDEYANQRSTRTKLKGTIEHFEFMAGLWKQRCHTLGVMLSNLRK